MFYHAQEARLPSGVVDGERFFWEHALPDGSDELRSTQPSVAVETESTGGR